MLAAFSRGDSRMCLQCRICGRQLSNQRIPSFEDCYGCLKNYNSPGPRDADDATIRVEDFIGRVDGNRADGASSNGGFGLQSVLVC